MSECAKCHVSVLVSDGHEFDEGDMCYSCLSSEYDKLRGLISSADNSNGSLIWISDHEKIVTRLKDCIRELLKGGEHEGECDNDQGMLNEGGACQAHCSMSDKRDADARKLLEKL